MICWTDSLEIAISLADNFPEIDPKTINFVDLRELVLNLEEFEEYPFLPFLAHDTILAWPLCH